MTKEEALEIALDYINRTTYWTEGRDRHDTLKAVKEALAQPAQEPSATRPCRSCDGTGERFTGIDEAPTSICKPCKGTGQIALAQPAQEPVAWMYWQNCLNDDGTQTGPWVRRLSNTKPQDSVIYKDVTALYAAPPQRPWVGLTREESLSILDDCRTPITYISMIEAKLKEKNT